MNFVLDAFQCELVEFILHICELAGFSRVSFAYMFYVCISALCVLVVACCLMSLILASECVSVT